MQPETRRTARAAKDQPRGAPPVTICCFASKIRAQILLPAATPPGALSSLCLCCTAQPGALHIQAVPERPRLFAGTKTRVTTSAHQRPCSHSICRDGRGNEQNRGDSGDWFLLTGSSPMIFLLLLFFVRVYFKLWKAAVPLSFQNSCSAQTRLHQPSSLPLQPCLGSKQSVS